MLEQQYACLYQDKDGQADTPPFVSFNSKEVGGAAKDIEWNSKASHAHTQDVLGVE
jgi:hypothetical protein